MEDKKNVKEHTKNLYELIKNRSEVGLVSQLNVLQIARDYNLREQELLEIEVKSLIDSVLAFKALGGGWIDLVEDLKE